MIAKVYDLAIAVTVQAMHGCEPEFTSTARLYLSTTGGDQQIRICPGWLRCNFSVKCLVFRQAEFQNILLGDQYRIVINVQIICILAVQFIAGRGKPIDT